jgi:hypothetical protein
MIILRRTAVGLGWRTGMPDSEKHSGRLARTHRPLTIALVVASAVIAPGAAPIEESAPMVTCRVHDDPRGREFALRPVPQAQTGRGAVAPGWQLSMREAESKGAWIDIRLPGAQPAITATAAKLSYRNANGGRQVDLDVSPSGSRLDVWVDYGLDVNIEPDLNPRVDRLNTEGPLTAVQCSIHSAAAPAPRD